MKATYLTGQLLLAMPALVDSRFHRSVIYICSHNANGAMGLIVNMNTANIDFSDLLDQLDIVCDQAAAGAPFWGDIMLHKGGPVETGRGFILHSADYVQESTLIISEIVALTATVDILAAIAKGTGPRDFIIALGYTGWAPGQLEQEIVANNWLTIEADEELLFRTDPDLKWLRAMAKMGVDITLLSAHGGNA